MAKLKANKPTADVLMNSMRAMGYSFEAAIADIVDNSVSAQARNIVLRFPIDPSDCCVAVCDDGIGMNKKELLDAMKYGSQLKSANRSEDDLGRFGLGMKAASLSQCRRLTVASKKDGKLSAYIWDLDIIEEKKDWYMVDCSKEQIAEIRYVDFLSDKESGTIVLWENFDLIEKSSGNVYAELGKHQNATAEYLSLIFHRYLNGEGRNPLTIMVNNYKLTGLDPFLENHRKTNVRRKIEIPIKDSEGKEQIVSVQPFVLPFQKDLSAEDKRLSGGIENYRAKQGFYIYRNKRLIIWGTWFGRHRDELTKYARIKVDIPNSLDDIWEIDIKKQHATIPAIIRNRLTKAVDEAMDLAVKAQTYRGRVEKVDEKVDYIWDRIKERDNQFVYRINRNSRIFDLLKEKVDDETWNRLDMVLDEIENSVPYQQIYIDKSQNRVDDTMDDERVAEIESKARILIKMSMDIGATDRNAVIGRLFQSEPFCKYPELAEKLRRHKMGLDIEKVAMLTGMVDKLVQMKHVDNALDESVVEELIQKALFISDVPYSDDEIAAVKRDIAYKYQIQARPGQSILADYEQANWYDDRKAEIQQNFWTRYKNYLIDEKHFSPNVVSTLGNDTLDQKLMNYILDPKADYGKPVLKRGLIIGDVQSGKTSTYIGFICKAADAGYKVFILLTGTIESLRKQTQERVEEGFIGIDMSANTTGGKRVGVGLDNKPIHAMALTSRASDFRGNSNKIAMSLGKDKDAVVFVIKKNTTTLTKLTKWLIDLNADPRTHKIDMPMLMIDDEADNASINTSSDKEDPTKINKLIRKLADVFTKSNYVGFTATPFANVFIDPETTEKMETHDLFPEDFIVALPTPSNYIGPTRIFPKDAEFHSQLVYITDAGREEEDGYSFYFKHKKDWKGKLPESMTDAIYAFYLANAIRDLRGDQREHRSMLINISRFVKVQKYIKEIVEKIHAEAYRSLKYNLSSDFELSMKDPVLNRIYKVWQSQYEKCGFTWDEVAAALFDAMEKIQIKVVNSSRSSEKLEYPKNESLRVIAIGGLALSRGPTLEGLIISYFYRNTCTYDVLMQMGRWFGYRRGYEDLFRIWTHKASAEWYAEIADATEKLKEDMVLMRDLGQKPRDFGIRVRNNSTDLNITAYNKMRNATDEFDVSSYFGSIVETPYLRFDVEAQKNNFRAVTDLVSECLSRGYRFERRATGSGRKGRYVLSDVPKELIVELIDRLSISKYSSYFNTKQISEFLSGCTDASIDVFDVAFMDGESPDKVADVCGQKITCVERKTCIIDSELDRLSIGRKGKLGGPGDGLVGIVDFNGKTAEEIIENAKASFRKFYEKEKGVPFDKTRVYPSETWFRFVVDRKPLLLIYLIDVGVAEENQKKQEAEFKAVMGNTPAVGLALGLPRNDEEAGLTSTRYKVNRVYNWFDREEMEDILAEGREE